MAHVANIRGTQEMLVPALRQTATAWHALERLRWRDKYKWLPRFEESFPEHVAYHSHRVFIELDPDIPDDLVGKSFTSMPRQFNICPSKRL